MDTQQDQWLEFLQQQGANIENRRVNGFGSTDAQLAHTEEDNTVIVPLTHLALLRARGSDTADFLQGQSSNDVRLVDSKHHQLNSYCSPKGRILALFTLFMRDQVHYLQLPQERLDPIQKRLGMFVMRSDVKLESAGKELPAFGLYGPQAQALLQKYLGRCPSEAFDTLTIDGVTILRQPGSSPRFSCFAEPDRLIALWHQLAPEVTPAGANAWDLQEIRAGIPSIEAEAVEAFVPQMVNLQLINGVNFKKGCYPGQEVVARMQYLGKLKRRMYRAHLESAQLPAAGSALFSPGSESGQGAGKVVRAAHSPNGGCELLAVAEISAAEEQALFLQSAEGPELKLLKLPYPFEPSDK